MDTVTPGRPADRVGATPAAGFGLYVVTHPGREAVLAATLESLRASGWPGDPVVSTQAADWPVGVGSAARHYKAVLDRALAGGRPYAVVLEDDVRVAHDLHGSLARWWPVASRQLHWGSLFAPDTLSDPWDREHPDLGYRLARPGLAAGPDALWQKHRLWGSQAFVFSRHGLAAASREWDRHPGGPDGRAVRIAAARGWPLWYSAPCLVDHAPAASAFGTPPAFAPDWSVDAVTPALSQGSYRHPEAVLGRLTYPEGRLLWDLARGGTVLELTRSRGRATCVLAQSAARVWSSAPSSPATARGWAKVFAPAAKVSWLLGPPADAPVLARETRFDLVLVEAGDDRAALETSIGVACQVLAQDGVVAVHGYPDPARPHVRPAVDAAAARRGWRRVRQAGYLAAFGDPAAG